MVNAAPTSKNSMDPVKLKCSSNKNGNVKMIPSLLQVFWRKGGCPARRVLLANGCARSDGSALSQRHQNESVASWHTTMKWNENFERSKYPCLRDVNNLWHLFFFTRNPRILGWIAETLTPRWAYVIWEPSLAVVGMHIRRIQPIKMYQNLVGVLPLTSHARESSFTDVKFKYVWVSVQKKRSSIHS